MATPPVIVLEDFLAPISEEAPTGVDLRADFSPQSLYFSIKDAQAQARTEERKRRETFEGVPDTAFRPEDWGPVLKYAEEALFEKSKDLEVAAWYLEALLRQHGFAGLRDGLGLLRGLVEKYWESIFPRPDEDGLATTVASLVALNGAASQGTLVWPISNVPIVPEADWGVWQYRQAQTLTGLDDTALEQRVAEGAITLTMFDEQMTGAPEGYYRDLLEDIQSVQEELRQLGAALDGRCGADDSGDPIAPSWRNTEAALAEVQRIVQGAVARLGIDVARPEDVEPAAEAAAAEGAVAPQSGGVAAAAVGVAGAMTREQAFKAILQLADFFKKTEPHSPVAYLLQKAVRWGKMPLPKLLHELINNEPMLSELYRVMGVEESTDENPGG